ncbi:MAG: rhodanese-like domain-containing protein [Magnetococcales bacterium]|nr:rhodanese-like domain-containing protein [Magnetococcales bacterium]
MTNRLVGALLLSLGLASGCAEPPYTNIDNDGVRALQTQGVPMYDIRRPDEWRQTGIVAGSRLLTFVDQNGKPMPDFFTRLTQEVNKEAPVILICRTGNRSDIVARHMMEKMGYLKVYNVRRGIMGWMDKGLPVVAPQ